MSFFSGFLIGQATARNGRNPGEGIGFLFVFGGVVALVLAILLTVAAFLLPVYAVIHLPLWAAEMELLADMGSVLIACGLLAVLPLAYGFGLFGNINLGAVGIGTLGLINLWVVLTLPHFHGSPLHEYKDLAERELITQNAMIASILGMVCATAFRGFITWRMSQERRDRIIVKLINPYIALHQSKIVGWVAFCLSGLMLFASLSMHINSYQRIRKFMEHTGKSYEEGFDFIFSGNAYQEDIQMLSIFAILFALALIHLFTQRRFASLQQ